MFKISAIVVAAGMSSRMGAFKPLLKLQGTPMIELVIEKFRNVGVEDILVVTGNRANELEPILSSLRVRYIRNEHYAETHMFDSAVIGIKKLLNQCDAAFFLPVDMPVFKIHSLKKMIELMMSTRVDIIRPCYKERRGHPLLIAESCFHKLLSHDGNNGLRGALNSPELSVTELQLPDPGLVMDADTAEDYKELCNYSERKQMPSLEECKEIQNYFHMQTRTIRHCDKVAEIARRLVGKLKQAGHFLDEDLVVVGALLHDLAKGSANHAEVGGEWLDDLGYSPVAKVVAAHTDLPEEAGEVIDERAVVFYADKLVKEDVEIPLDEKIQGSLQKFGNAEAVRTIVMHRMNAAKRIQIRIDDIVTQAIGEGVNYAQEN